MDFMELLSGFMQNLTVALLPVLVGFVVAWVRAKIKVELGKLDEQYPVQFGIVEMIAQQVVAAAEQAGAAGFVDDKLSYATDLAEKWLHQYNLVIDLDLVIAAIEAEVGRQFPKS